MNRQQTEKFRSRLQEHARRLQGTAESAEEQARTAIGGDGNGDLSKTPYHLGDQGSEAYAQELGATLLENEQYLQGEVLAALKRIEDNAYGKCENCGKAISTARLDALPYARHCVKCAQAEEKGAVNLNQGRPSNWSDGIGLRADGPPSGKPGAPEEKVVEDVHATGTPGGGTAVGGLAGTNVGTGEPENVDLEAAMGSGAFDVAIEAEPEPAIDEMGVEGENAESFAGHSGGAVGGTPANKRATGGGRKDEG